VNPISAALYTVFIFVQCAIAALLSRAAGRRWKGSGLALARAAVYAFSAVVIVGYLLTMSDLMSRWGLHGGTVAILGAIDFAYLLAVTGVLAVYGLLWQVRRQFNAEVNPVRRRMINAAGNALMAGPFVVIGYGALIQRTDFHVREIDVPMRGLPDDLDGLRLLQISDIHLSPFLSEAELARAIDAALDLRPHVALITGDLISSRGDPLDACIRQLARVKADAGVFGCMGNHERYVGVESYTALAAGRVGIQFLRSEARQLRFGNAVLNLAGVDYQSLAGKQLYLKGAERLVVPGAFNVLLSHNPDVFPVAARQGYNLLLAGHTHGGQVTVEILDQSINPARFLTPYVYGLYRLPGGLPAGAGGVSDSLPRLPGAAPGGPAVTANAAGGSGRGQERPPGAAPGSAAAYVTRGIGTIGIPARIGAPPEISLVRLRKA
jgi:predicted MPP superfamily phosphohydrolase